MTPSTEKGDSINEIEGLRERLIKSEGLQEKSNQSCSDLQKKVNELLAANEELNKREAALLNQVEELRAKVQLQQQEMNNLQQQNILILQEKEANITADIHRVAVDLGTTQDSEEKTQLAKVVPLIFPLLLSPYIIYRRNKFLSSNDSGLQGKSNK